MLPHQKLLVLHLIIINYKLQTRKIHIFVGLLIQRTEFDEFSVSPILLVVIGRVDSHLKSLLRLIQILVGNNGLHILWFVDLSQVDYGFILTLLL